MSLASNCDFLLAISDARFAKFKTIALLFQTINTSQRGVETGGAGSATAPQLLGRWSQGRRDWGKGLTIPGPGVSEGPRDPSG